MAVAPRILIVDDDLPFVGRLSAALKPPYEVSASPSRTSALKAITDHPPDLILLSHLLPDASGLAVLRAIKESFPATIVILMTAFSSEDACLESFRSGARDYLRKRVNLPDLQTRIEKLLTSRNGRAERRAPVLLDMARVPPMPAKGSRAANLQRAVAHIEDHLDAQLTLGQVAREAGMSQSHFCRALKDFTGVTFREHLARRRVARAASLLRDKQLSIKDVCFEVGLHDPTYFARLFRKLAGYSPSHFRAAHYSKPASEPVGVPPAQLA